MAAATTRAGKRSLIICLCAGLGVSVAVDSTPGENIYLEQMEGMPSRTAFRALRKQWPTLRDVMLTSGARAYAAFTSLLGLVLTVRWLGADGRGVVVVITTWVAVFANLGSLSLWQVAVHRSAQGQGKPWLGPFLGALTIVSVAATVVGWGTIALLSYTGGHRLFEGIPIPALALGFIALPFLMWELFVNSLLSVTGKLAFHNLNQVIGRTTGLIALFVGVKVLNLGVYGFLLSYLLTEALLAAAGVRMLLRGTQVRFRDGMRQLRGMVRDGLKMHLHTLGVLLYTSSDILLLHYFHGAAAAGIYQFASTIFFALMLVPQSAALVLQNRVASVRIEEFWAEQRTVVALVTMGMTIVAALTWAAAPWVVAKLATPAFSEAATVLRILLLAVPAGTLAWLMTVQWLARGYFFRLGLTYLVMGVVNCSLNLILIPRYGMIGAAGSSVIMWCVVSLAANLCIAAMAQAEARSERLIKS